MGQDPLQHALREVGYSQDVSDNRLLSKRGTANILRKKPSAVNVALSGESTNDARLVVKEEDLFMG